MAFLPALLSLFVEFFRPRQHGKLNSIRTEVVKIFSVIDYPNSGQVRFAVRGLGRWGREVRFTIRSSRNPRRGIVQPLCVKWNNCEKKDDESRNRSRNRHVSLPLFQPLYRLPSTSI